MRKEAALPVRLEPDLRRRLKATAETMGMTTSSLVRLLARSFVDEFERQGGKVVMPPEWQTGRRISAQQRDSWIPAEPGQSGAETPQTRARKVAEQHSTYARSKLPKR